MNSLWNVSTLDRVVFLFPTTVVAVIVIAMLYRLRRKRRVRSQEFWEPIVAATTLLILFVGIYAGYASFRNQTRLAAETALNEDADNLQAIEFEHPEIRCLYGNFGHDDPAACLKRLVDDADKWSLAIDYVEESLVTLGKATADRRDWGSQYAQEIRYWADDVSSDTTGLFGYYLVNQFGPTEAPRVARDRGICIPDLCASYDRVRAALIQAKAQPAGPDLCASSSVRLMSRTKCE